MSAEHGAPRPLMVAVVGSGPAGFYLSEQLFKLAEQKGRPVRVDLLERLPAPFGLVRYGVAPDHQKIKNVTRVYERIASREDFRFFGNVEYCRHVHLEHLRRHYDLVAFATGAQTDRRLGIPGEDLERSHAATEFVAWYNGHPDFRDRRFDLSVERVAVIGVGNVAVDVARILCRTVEELEKTDIADHALEALRESRVREVYMLGRRGPAQAAFTNPEIKELGELPGADLIVRPEDMELDPVSREEIEQNPDKETLRKLEILREFAERKPQEKPRRLVLRFLASPVEILDDGQGHVGGMKIVRNRLERGEDGRIRAVPTGETEELPVQMVFRSVGYRGVALEGVPFDERRGVVPNHRGRVVDPETGNPIPGVYVAGWIKRGPTGVIGTNKPDAAETAEAMMEDAALGIGLGPEAPSPEAAGQMLHERRPHLVTYEDWKRLDQEEVERGRALGRPRVKFVDPDEVLARLGKG